jgi:hypothetical protein
LQALFCSKDCFDGAWGSYHKLECDARNNYTQKRIATDFTSNSIMVTICCKMVSMFGVEKCIHAISDMEAAPQPLKDMLHLPLALYPMGILDKTRGLAKKVAADCFGMSGEKLHHLTEFLVMAMMIFKRNAVKISHPQYHAETDILVNQYSIGWGLYMNSTRVMHSCMPNTFGADFEGKTLVFFAVLPIQPGEMLTVDYVSGIELPRSSTEARREEIQQMFNFHCKCEACMKG